MNDQLDSLIEQRKKALNILIEKDFFKIFDSFFEACTRFSFTAELDDGTPSSNWIYVHGKEFIQFFQKNSGVDEFSVNDINDSQKCAHQILFSENFEIQITLKELGSHLTINIVDIGSGFGTFTFSVDGDLVYSGQCSTVNIDHGLGRVVLKHRVPEYIERVILKKRWVNEILPEFDRIIRNTIQEIIDFETQKLKQGRLVDMTDNIDIGDFE